MAPFVWRDGVHVTGTALWCDARRARSLCFLSHAGRRPGGRHRQLLCTPETLQLLSAEEPAPPGRGAKPGGPPPPGEALRCPYGRPFSLGGLRLELFPSGYLPGAASLLVTLDGGRRRLVYAGDLNPEPGLGCPGLQVRAAEALVCHAPLAALGRPLPSRAEAEEAVRVELGAAQEAGAAAVFLVPELGPAQDLLALLTTAGAEVLPHARVQRYVPIYAQLGVRLPAGAGPLGPRRGPRPGAAILWPLERPLGPLLRGAGGVPLHLVLCAGAALSEEAVGRYAQTLPPGLRLRAALPFPEGMDLPGLLRYVEISGAREVYLTAGASEVVERALGRLRVRVTALGPPRQLELFAA